ncbi:MAG: UDP-N-acetylmuramate--L-alanine ligase [Oscillospiraceae bacterium]|nr:UDP-N-acetylmuramate--L-alanine ligase [Oscillospiraceae bacterium]
MNVTDIGDYIYITRHAHGHLVGIGGVSMAPLAEVLKGMGVVVSGSDISESDSVKHLRSLGITVHIGHDAANIEGADFVIRTAAAHDDNPEIVAARAAGIPVFERAEAWGYLMKSYKNAVCIAGTHGKTTTTSMATHILMKAEVDPTIMIGGTLPLLKAGHRIGQGDTIVMESCEYYNSFLSFYPTIAVINNVDADHLDFFKDLEDIKASFRRFAELVPAETGWIVANGDDQNTMDTLAGIERNVITFGLGEACEVRAENISAHRFGTDFDVVIHGKLYASVSLAVPGEHNIRNALGACTAAWLLGVPAHAVSQALATFTGAGRRFEYKGALNGAKIYDDYAHHPGELQALLDMALALDYKRVILCFQPHTYSRTQAQFDNFVKELSRPTLTYLAEIYAAREQNTIGISSKDLADRIPGARFFPFFEELEEALRETAQAGDLILTVGAGNIYRVGEDLIDKG